MKRKAAKAQSSRTSPGDAAQETVEWPMVKLREVCRQDRRIIEPNSEEAGSRPYLSLEHIESNTGRILRSSSESILAEGKSTTFAFDERHVLYCKLRPYLNKVALPAFVGRCTTELIPLLADERLVSRDFLAFLLRRQETVAAAMQDKTGSRMPRADMEALLQLPIPVPPLAEQRRVAGRLREQLASVAQARAAVQAQTETLATLSHAVLRESLNNGKTQPVRFADCLHEITEGIGGEWQKYPVLGATRAGLAPAKEPVGKNPGRYKPVREGTIFDNPMRILLGSVAMVDEGDASGITSPDYVVMTAVEGRLNARWFYQWFRSRYGAEFIKSMTRGAVRERLMFRRLAPTSISLPDVRRQEAAARQFAEIRKVKAKLAEQLGTFDRLPAALLREAFGGKSTK